MIARKPFCFVLVAIGSFLWLQDSSCSRTASHSNKFSARPFPRT